MRQSLPLIHCVSEDVRAKLLGMITELDSVPQPEWEDWKPDKPRLQVIFDDVDYDREMRKTPSPSPRSRK